MRPDLSHAALFSATAPVGFANAVVRPLLRVLEDKGLAGAATSGFGINPIVLASFLLSLLATIYPAIRAARTQPAEALRYE